MTPSPLSPSSASRTPENRNTDLVNRATEIIRGIISPVDLGIDSMILELGHCAVTVALLYVTFIRIFQIQFADKFFFLKDLYTQIDI